MTQRPRIRNSSSFYLQPPYYLNDNEFFERLIFVKQAIVSISLFGFIFVLLFGAGCNNQNKSEANSPLTTADVLTRWHSAFAEIRSLRGSQKFDYIDSEKNNPQGGKTPSLEDNKGDLQSTEEIHELAKDRTRSYFTSHYAKVDEITILEVKEATRYRPWLNELYHPLPESYASGEYWIDDLDDLSLLALLRPLDNERLNTRVSYDFVGVSVFEGRQVIELIVKPGGHTIPTGIEGTRILLDSSTYLPCQVTIPQGVWSYGGRSVTRTVTKLEVNPNLVDSDFGLNLPPGTTVVYVQANGAPKLKTYKSAHEAALDVEFPLFLPEALQPQESFAMYFVENNGKNTPVLAFKLPGEMSILEGTYLPKYDTQRIALNELMNEKPEDIQINGIQATLRVGKTGRSALVFNNAGTIIEISGKMERDKIIELARNLKQIS